MQKKCQVNMGKPGEEKEQKTKDDETLGLDLVLFFDTLHQTEPTPAYTNAFAKIAKMDTSLKSQEPGIDIEIPVKVIFKQSDDGLKELDRLLNVSRAEKMILERWSAIETELVKSKAFRCTFVLYPMVVIFDIGYSAKLVKSISALLTENVWFSKVELLLDAAITKLTRNCSPNFVSLVFGSPNMCNHLIVFSPVEILTI
ncbi:hypothetical protein P3T76_014933 [Phytophthora citrophthora]|uniref:Uncharacterized protein n=1 Tax=Phytophthora citrophthora TaxID=4793 RepID=A0AAD9G0E5_9STRA|nr:hypothetical protein P3T76_014933 [Phytophthora citrophthora]